jgi:L-fuconolactonase
VRVDAHHHLWDPRVVDQPWLSKPGLERLRRAFTVGDLSLATLANGIDRTVVVQTVASPAETRLLLELAEAQPLLAGVVGWVDLTRPDVDEQLAALRDAPGGKRLVAVRHGVQAEPDPGWLARPDVRRGLTALAEAGLAFDLLVRAAQLPAALDAVRAVPGLTFVLDHLGQPPADSWAADLRALAREPNVCAKISGLTLPDPRPAVETALAAFGPGRLMFGSDWPVCLLAASYAEVLMTTELLTTALSTTECAAVFGGTAVRAYRLEER